MEINASAGIVLNIEKGICDFQENTVEKMPLLDQWAFL
jgi:hypothetical protein